MREVERGGQRVMEVQAYMTVCGMVCVSTMAFTSK